MTNYTKTTDFAAKDSLPSGDSGKIIRGSEFETEFDNIATAVNSKSDANNPTFTGTVTIDGLTVNGNTILGNAATDTVTVTADIASNLIPSADDTYNLGAVGAEWNDLYVDGVAYIDTIDGFATTGNVTFGDNDKAIFGAGSDLQIFHDGSNSYISDSGTGDLQIKGTNLYLKGSNNETFMYAVENGPVRLYHDNSQKLITTTTGIDVTGTVNAGDEYRLSNFSFSRIAQKDGGGGFAGGYNFKLDGSNPEHDSTGTLAGYHYTSGGQIRLYASPSSAANTSATERVRIENDGDISFYEDTGTTAKLFWDASLESLGIGTTSLTPTDGANIVLSSSTSSRLLLDNTGASGRKYAITSDTSGNLGFYDYDASAFRILVDSSGDVGIGTSTPNIANFTKALTILDSAASDQVPAIELAFGSNTRGANIAVDNRTSVKALAITAVASDLSMTFGTNNTERMRIDSSGNVQQATSVNGDLYHHIYNANTGTSTEATLYISNGPAVSSGLFAGTTGTAFTTVGGFVQDGAHIGAGSASAGGLSIMTRANAPIRFYTNGHTNERMRLDESGNLLVGMTNDTPGLGDTDTGASFRADGASFVSRTLSDTSGSTFYVNRNTNDGNLIQFQKDGSVVGSIGANGGRPYFASGGCGVKLGGSDFTPVTSAGATSDNVVNLGSATARFKDLYLSGFINAGNDIRMKQTNPRIDYDNGSSGSLRFFSTSANTERMRITSGGDLLVGLTSSDYLAADDGIQLNANGTARFGGSGTSARNLLSFVNGTDGTPAEVGFIQTNGSATSYSTSSDQRLKENIVDAPSASDDIDAIQVRSFDWKADGSHQKYGMVAQELQSVAPEAVSGDADSEDMMGVDYSKLVPMLVKEIQSLRARVAQLEGAN